MTVAVSALPDTVVGEFRLPECPWTLRMILRFPEAAASVGYSRCPQDKLLSDEKEGLRRCCG